MSSRKRGRKLTQAELRALDATPGLVSTRIGADGRATVEQLAPESRNRRKDFARRLTSTDEAS